MGKKVLILILASGLFALCAFSGFATGYQAPTYSVMPSLMYSRSGSQGVSTTATYASGSSVSIPLSSSTVTLPKPSEYDASTPASKMSSSFAAFTGDLTQTVSCDTSYLSYSTSLPAPYNSVHSLSDTVVSFILGFSATDNYVTWTGVSGSTTLALTYPYSVYIGSYPASIVASYLLTGGLYLYRFECVIPVNVRPGTISVLCGLQNQTSASGTVSDFNVSIYISDIVLYTVQDVVPHGGSGGSYFTNSDLSAYHDQIDRILGGSNPQNLSDVLTGVSVELQALGPAFQIWNVLFTGIVGQPIIRPVIMVGVWLIVFSSLLGLSRIAIKGYRNRVNASDRRRRAE